MKIYENKLFKYIILLPFISYMAIIPILILYNSQQNPQDYMTLTSKTPLFILLYLFFLYDIYKNDTTDKKDKRIRFIIKIMISTIVLSELSILINSFIQLL